MPADIKCAVIGVGNMGKNHVRTYHELANVDLVAIADVSATLGEAAAAQYDVPYYADYSAMIKERQPELVSICVPTAYHFAVASACLELGVNILLEKPIAMTVEDGEALLKLAKEKNLKLLVGHIERFNPGVQKVKEIVERGDLGKIISIMARRVGGFPPQIKDANIAVDLAIHDLDIVNYLLEELPKEVQVFKQRNHIKAREDSVEFFLKYEGASAYVQANWITPVKIRKLNITGTEGYLELDYVNQKIEFYKSNYEKFETPISQGFSDFILKFSDPDITDISIAKKEPLKEEILYLIDCIQNNKNVDAQYAVDALRIALTD